MKLTSYKKTTLSTDLLITRAREFGIKVNPLLPNSQFFEFKYKNHSEYLRAQIFSATNSTADFILQHKSLTKKFLAINNLTVPKGDVFSVSKITEAIKYAKKIKFPVVVKPNIGTHGDDVYMDIENSDQLKTTLNMLKNKIEYFVIEHQFKGKEYRITATNKKVLGITYRVPANVEGDGKSTIAELVKKKNKDPKRGSDYNYSLIEIVIDNQVKKNLKKHKLSIKSIPKKGEVIYLRNNSNLSTGGDSYDWTDKAHPSVKKIAVEAIKAIPGLPFAGIDFLTKDITKKQTKNSYIIIEMNETPMISMHHFPYSGKQRDAAGEIIKLLFPELKKK
ncbi:hypothetical protein KKF29_01925 [Patescibacteria group bacterium]|nr:hypothetical protein [Patescibacteria group bacterium]